MVNPYQILCIILIFIILAILGVLLYNYIFITTTVSDIFNKVLVNDEYCSVIFGETEANNIIRQNQDYPTESRSTIRFLMSLMLIFVYELNDIIPSSIEEYKDFIFVDHPIVRVYVDNLNYAWVCFRGTSRNNEVEQEIRVEQEMYYNVSVHSGFRYILKAVEEDILEYLATKGVRRIYGLGHSMGGALSSIFIVRLLNIYESSSLLFYTIGTPKSGYYTNPDPYPITNIINNYDVVPIIIPPNLVVNNKSLTYTYNGRNEYQSFNYNCTSSNHSIIGYYYSITPNLENRELVARLKMEYDRIRS